MTIAERTQAQLVSDLEEAFRSGRYLAVLALLEERGQRLRPAIRAFHRARALVKSGQPEPALRALDRVPGTSVKLWHRKIRIRALIELGRFGEATALFDTMEFPQAFKTDVCAQAAAAALDAGAYRQAAAWGLRYRRAVPGPDARFVDDLVAFVLLGDVAALQARLALCGGEAARTLGRALHCAEPRFARAGVSGASLRARVAPVLRLAHDLAAMWDVFNGLNLGGPMASAEMRSIVWHRISTLLPPVPIGYDDPPEPCKDIAAPLPEIDRVADWIGVPAEDRADWHARHAAARASVTAVSAAILGSAAHRDDLARRLPPADWSAVRAVMAAGTPVILTACHASLAEVLPLEFQRSGIDVRVVSPPRHFASVPEFLAMHYADLDGRNAMRTARRMVELLREGACIFATADGQMGARLREIPDLGVRARLPSGLWPLARRYGARVFLMQTGWHQGHLHTRLRAMDPPKADLDDAALHALWHRDVLRVLFDAWRGDLRNIHQNRVVVGVTRPGGA